MVPPKIEARRTVLVVITVVLIDFCRSFVLSIHGSVELSSVMAGGRLTFPIIAVDFKTSHFQDIRFVDSLHDSLLTRYIKRGYGKEYRKS